MKTDYKFWYTKRYDSGDVVSGIAQPIDVGRLFEVAVRYYEGDYETIDGEQVYKRYEKLQEKDLKHCKGRYGVDRKGSPVVIYTEKDFGTIFTDDELRDFLDSELAKDAKRSAILEQDVKILNKEKR